MVARIAQTTGVEHTAILGLGVYRPARIVTNVNRSVHRPSIGRALAMTSRVGVPTDASARVLAHELWPTALQHYTAPTSDFERYVVSRLATLRRNAACVAYQPPLLLTRDDITVTEGEHGRESSQQRRRLQATFPAQIDMASP